MKTILPKILLTAALASTLPVSTLAQDDDSEALKLAAVEALMVAPPEKALPVVQRLLEGDSSHEIKARALFVLGQINLPEANAALLDFARDSDGDLQLEAIRTIGISGDPALTDELGTLYAQGSPETREAILEAWMIAGDEASVLAVAESATTDEEFDAAVEMLGVMGATESLQQLRGRAGATESLIQAWAIAGDTDSLLALARDSSDPEQQIAALQGLGIAGGADAEVAFMEIYRDTDNPDVRQGAMHGMMIAGHDEGVLELFKAAEDDQEKAELLRLLVMMDSDAAMEAINDALGEQP